MTKISLRVYNREIEAMVESGQVDEAIAHCQYILKTFPMHLETYRLLGKAFLESRRYSDAADIFQRVLMSVPEDFVSHVGMSIIRDDENKLDEAIWHMERAFEVQPSNPAIQDELRKLYGRRDGVQPPKVRLTRDALANMYAQGALYSQAIAEIRAVLADDPDRPDLQVMLARAYSKDGRKKQAIEICTELLKKYPYCFDALRILIDLMPPSDQHEFTQTYRLRVRALDPYAGFVTGSIFNSDNVPDAAVNLELLDYDPNEMDSGSQPAWASSLGIKLEPEKGQEDIPEWLSEKTSEIQPVSGEENLTRATEVEGTSEIEGVPDWMRSSGWEKTTDQTIENSAFDETEIENDEPLARAEIPEWLKEMAPDEELLESDKLPDGFETMLAGNSINSPLLDSISNKEHEPDLKEDDMEEDISEEVVSDWLKDGEINEPIQTETGSTDVSPWMEPNLDGFNKLSSEESQEQSEEAIGQPVDDIPSWLGEVKPGAIDGGIELNENKDLEDDLPDWLKDIGSENPDGDLDETNDPTAEILEESDIFSSGANEIDPKMEATAAEELPEWLKDAGMDKPVDATEISNEPVGEIKNEFEAISSVGDQIEHNIKSMTEDELPDWFKEIDLTEEAISPNDELASILGVEEDVTSQVDGQKAQLDLEPMTELEGLGYKEEIQIQTSEGTTPETEPEDAGLPSMDDQDAAMAWLESLAAKQGAKAEELLTKPEDRLEEPPEWVKNSIEDELKHDDEEAIISVPSEPELIDVGKDENESIVEKETEGIELTGGEEQPHVFEATGQEELIEEDVISSMDIGEFSEVSTREELDDSLEVDDSLPKVQSSSVDEELTLVEGPQAGFTVAEEIAVTPGSEIDTSPDADISKWLTELDGDDETSPEENISPKVSEFYGNELSEPLPDWLKEMEKEASSSEWISESGALPGPIKEINKVELTPEVKDIDDIGEIFPADPSSWNLEDSESEPVLEEPLSDEIKPVTSGEWQPLQPEQKTLVEETTDISKTGPAIQSNEPLQGSKLPGTGMLSKIPARDIEKEAGTLERAQSFIESGDIKKAIETYARLIKKGQLLEGVIHDLRETTYRYPVEIGIWQLLGDAYMRANRLQDALDAYTKAEELLR